MAAQKVYLRQAGGEDSSRIYLDGADDILWAFETGGSSPQVPLRVSDHVDRQLIESGALGDKPTKWDLVFVEPGRTPVTIKDIWLGERRRSIGPDKALWFMSDRRTALASVLVDSTFNKLRIANEYARPDIEDGFVNDNISKFSQVSLSHFVPFTCVVGASQDVGNPRNGDFYALSGDKTREDYQPWTALRALVWLLRDDGFLKMYPGITDLDGKPFSFGELKITERVKDRRIILKNWNPRNTWPNAVNDLARRARVMVYVDENGSFVVDDLTPRNDIFKGYGIYRGAGGIPILASLQRKAPRSATIHFPEWKEIKWMYDEEMAFKTEDRMEEDNRSWFLNNVLKLPQDTTNFMKGQWVTIREALNEFQLDADQFGINKSFVGNPKDAFTIQKVRDHALTSALASLWIRDVDNLGFRSPVLEARVSSIYQYYRRAFRIPEKWLDYIEDIKMMTGRIFNTTTRTRQPPPVWCDYHSWDNSIYRARNTPGDEGTGYLKNYPIEGTIGLLPKDFADVTSIDPRIMAEFQEDSAASSKGLVKPSVPGMTPARVDQGQRIRPAPAKLFILDKTQGVVTLNFPPDLTGCSTSWGPGLVIDRERGSRAIMTVELGFAQFKSKMAYHKDFRLISPFAVKWRTPNSPKRFFSVKTQGVAYVERATGPDADVYFPGFDALRAWEEGKVTYRFKDEEVNGLKIDHEGTLVDEGALKEIAAGKFEEIYFRFLPRVIGMFRSHGWTGQLPTGHVRATTLSFRQGALETSVNAENVPLSPSLWEFLSDNTRDMLAGLESMESMGR